MNESEHVGGGIPGLLVDLWENVSHRGQTICQDSWVLFFRVQCTSNANFWHTMFCILSILWQCGEMDHQWCHSPWTQFQFGNRLVPLLQLGNTLIFK